MVKYEGKNAVIEALRSGTILNKLLISNTLNKKAVNEIMELTKGKNIRIQFVDNNLIKKESETATPQGLIGFGSDYEYLTIDDIISQNDDRNKIVLILDGIEDPHNFGSIIRSAECFGVDGIIIGKNRSCLVTETVIKSSAGAISHVKIARETNIHDCIKKLKDNGFWVYGLELGGRDINEIDFCGNVALIVGSEGKGIGALTRKLCDDIATLDLKGKVNSLNASVAAGIGLYEISNRLN